MIAGRFGCEGDQMWLPASVRRLAMGIALLVIAHGGGYCCGVVIREEGGVVIREEGDGCRWLLYGFHIL
ncbi:uncharacterized protein M6B38_350070 [Iris pallida]|uniref:Uncharacterized protein n=1 Tax=Iris pallida TaxID=29817 RepID=A0AAX6GRS7_IRIPA|nr:uncharacterized protein M6B38_350070 [Iris pallida]